MSGAQTFLDEAKRLREAGDYYEAAMRQRSAIAFIRDGDDPLALAHALRHLGDMLVDGGMIHDAEPPIAEALALYGQTPGATPLDVANAFRSAGVQAEAADELEAAHAYWSEARDRYEELGVGAGVREADERLNSLPR